MSPNGLKPSRRTILAGMMGAGVLPYAARGALVHRKMLSARSPDGRIRVNLMLPARDGDSTSWSADLDGRSILDPGPLALVLDDGTLLGPGAKLVGHEITRSVGRWRPPYGIASSYDESHGQLIATFEDKARRIRFDVIVRAYDDGIALRYRLVSAPGDRVMLSGERTHLRLPPGTTVYTSRDEGPYAISRPSRIDPPPHPDLTRSTDQGPLADTPLTALTSQGLALSIGESDRLHYPRTMLRSAEAPDTIVTHLMRFPGRATGYSGPGETPPEMSFAVETPFTTPWRVVTVATTQAGLIEKAGLVPTLATPNRLGNVDWVRPGRAFRIRKPYTTDNALRCIDFAAIRKLDYVEFDAHWYGDGTDPSDATAPISGLDLPRVIARARDRGIGTILYVDRVPAMRQLDAIVATYSAWGVAGIKFGFIWEGRQEDVDFIYNLVRTCGEHRLLVNLHDNLRPAGLERTLPNYLALEGVRGNEQFPSARHNVTLPFTRCLSGPIDYTICNANPRNQTTRAHQLAMAAVYYNPLTFLYWYDGPEKYEGREWPELAFFDECPTSWDETRALSGSIGEHVAIARRHGQRWFLGAMTNEQGRTLSLPLAFLGDGAWTARIHRDGAPAGTPSETPVLVEQRAVVAGTTLELTLAPSGGQAIIFTPS